MNYEAFVMQFYSLLSLALTFRSQYSPQHLNYLTLYLQAKCKRFGQWYVTVRATAFKDLAHRLSIQYRTQHFGKWISFRPRVKKWGIIYSGGSDRRR
jgi:hypothetical protein